MTTRFHADGKRDYLKGLRHTFNRLRQLICSDRSLGEAGRKAVLRRLDTQQKEKEKAAGHSLF